MDNKVFDTAFLQKLEMLSLRVRSQLTGKNSGERRSKYKGSSVEFADFRNYTLGDDWRQIDWNAYARFDKLFVKLFLEEKEINLNLFLDLSNSMEWGNPSKSKLAKQVAGALAYLSLAAYDRVSITCFNEEIINYLPPLRGKEAFWRVLEFLENTHCGGNTDINKALFEFGRWNKEPGISVLISDLLVESGYQEGIKFLQYLKQEVNILQILSVEEIAPQFHGELRLVDSETGQFREVSVTSRILQLYRHALEAYQNEIRDFCCQRGVEYFQFDTNVNIEDLLLRNLKEKGFIS